MDTKKYRRRLPHIHVPGHSYFLTFCLSRGQEKEMTPEERTLVQEHLLRMVPGSLAAFVVMPDHVHLIYHSAEGETLHRTLKSLKGSSSHALVQNFHREAPVWQSETFDRLIRDEDELVGTWKYIEANPIRRGLTQHPGEYRWASDYGKRGQECPPHGSR